MIKKYIKTTPVEAIQVKPYNYDEVESLLITKIFCSVR